MKDRNSEGYYDPTASKAIRAADRPPEDDKSHECDLSCAGSRESNIGG